MCAGNGSSLPSFPSLVQKHESGRGGQFSPIRHSRSFAPMADVAPLGTQLKFPIQILQSASDEFLQEVTERTETCQRADPFRRLTEENEGNEDPLPTHCALRSLGYLLFKSLNPSSDWCQKSSPLLPPLPHVKSDAGVCLGSPSASIREIRGKIRFLCSLCGLL